MYAHNSNDVVKYEDDGYKMKTIDVYSYVQMGLKCVNTEESVVHMTFNNTDKTQIWCVESLLLQ